MICSRRGLKRPTVARHVLDMSTDDGSPTQLVSNCASSNCRKRARPSLIRSRPPEAFVDVCVRPGPLDVDRVRPLAEYDPAPSEDEPHRWILHRDSEHLLEAGGNDRVVLVEKLDVLPCRQEDRAIPVCDRGQPLRRDVDANPRVAVGAHDLRGGVGGAAVRDDEFERLVGLGQDRFDRSPDPALAVVGRNCDRYERSPAHLAGRIASGRPSSPE